jgi:hypothetical protein
MVLGIALSLREEGSPCEVTKSAQSVTVEWFKDGMSLKSADSTHGGYH